ncbi:MAG TPA: hypothetical protein ENN41_07210, partial [Sediminispirochaeta sp.]|nr:hypothetical protein [Sediminispirochaeta sp.]
MMEDKDKNTAPKLSTGLLVDEEADRGLLSKVKYVGRLLWRDKAGLIGLSMFLLVIFAALFSPYISPHDPMKQNLQ